MRVSEEYLVQKRHAIAQVAMRMYCERGRDVSIAAICQEAGIAKGTIFRYFPTRDAMFADIFDACRTHAEELSVCGVVAGESDEETLLQLIRQAFVWPLEFPLEFQFVTMYTDANAFFIFQGDGSQNRFDALDSPRYAGLVRRNVRPDLPEGYASRALSALVNTAARYAISHRGEMTQAHMEGMVASVYDAVFVRPKA